MLVAIETLLEEARPLILVRILEVRGSSPRDSGTFMLVADAATGGTIGGGRLEHLAVGRARAMLATGGERDAMSVPLGPDIGQCCGGFVKLDLERVDGAVRAQLRAELVREASRRPHVYVFGAGHVGLALTTCLLPMPLRPVLIDSRGEALAEAPGQVETRLLALPESALAQAPSGSAIVVLTHDHALDFLITGKALAAGRFAYVGMIGSKTKRAMFRRSLADSGVTDAALVCPMGGSAVRDKRPQIIAALVAAEIATRLFACVQAEADDARPHAVGYRQVDGGQAGARIFPIRRWQRSTMKSISNRVLGS